MTMERVDERVVEISICDQPDGRVELTVVSIDHAGRAVVEVVEGDGMTVRSRARLLAAQHDLVPEWLDRSWIRGGVRPPASRYVVR